MNPIRAYFLFILFLHVSIPVFTYWFLGINLRAESKYHDLVALYPLLFLTLCVFFIGMWIGSLRFRFGSFSWRTHTSSRFTLHKDLFLVQAILFLLVSSSLRYSWGIHSYFGHLLMHANCGVLIFVLANIKQRSFGCGTFLLAFPAR